MWLPIQGTATCYITVFQTNLMWSQSPARCPHCFATHRVTGISEFEEISWVSAKCWATDGTAPVSLSWLPFWIREVWVLKMKPPLANLLFAVAEKKKKKKNVFVKWIERCPFKATVPAGINRVSKYIVRGFVKTYGQACKAQRGGKACVKEKR